MLAFLALLCGLRKIDWLARDPLAREDGDGSRLLAGDGLTFAVENFFSVPMTAPDLCAAFRALLPLTTVSRVLAPGPRALLPILVTASQSSLMVGLCEIDGDLFVELLYFI